MSIARVLTGFALLICLCGGLLQTTPAAAQSAVDLLGILPGGNSSAHFGTAGMPPLPADFFGPGSDPFDGQVALQTKELIDPSSANGTIRIGWPAPPIWPHDPVGTGTVIDIEIIELQLASAQPLTITYFGGASTELWNMEMTLSVLPAPPGAQSTTKTHDNGGVYSSILVVQPHFKFIRTSDGQEIDLDTGLAGYSPLNLDASGGHWVHEPDPLLGLAAPSSGLFVSCVLEGVPGDPASQCPVPLLAIEPSDALVLELIPAELLPPPDPFCSLPGDQPDGTHIVFGPSDNPPIPPEFFGPGSDPFSGHVPLFGEPLGPTSWGDFEDADSLTGRETDPFDRCELPSVELRTVEIEVLALNLRSIEPIVVTYNGGQFPEPWDVQMSISPTGENYGFLTVTKTHANGGTFNADFLFHPRYVFTRVSDSFQVVLDVGLAGGVPLDFVATDGHWVHTVLSGLDLLAPSDGQFVPGVEEVFPGDPGSQEVRFLHADEFTGAGRLTLRSTLRDVSGIEMPAVRVETLQVHPNPFNPVTQISFELAQSGPVSLRIFDVRGGLIRTLAQEILPAGHQEYLWRALDDRGRRVASGVYLSVLETADGVQTAKMAVIK